MHLRDVVYGIFGLLSITSTGTAGTTVALSQGSPFVPGADIQVKILVSTTEPISSSKFVVRYDDNCLSFVQAQLGPGAPAGSLIGSSDYSSPVSGTPPCETNHSAAVNIAVPSSYTGFVEIATMHFLVQPSAAACQLQWDLSDSGMTDVGGISLPTTYVPSGDPACPGLTLSSPCEVARVPVTGRVNSWRCEDPRQGVPGVQAVVSHAGLTDDVGVSDALTGDYALRGAPGEASQIHFSRVNSESDFIDPTDVRDAIDAADVALIQNYVLEGGVGLVDCPLDADHCGASALPDGLPQRIAADVDGDGMIALNDVLILLNLIEFKNGALPTFPSQYPLEWRIFCSPRDLGPLAFPGPVTYDPVAVLPGDVNGSYVNTLQPGLAAGRRGRPRGRMDKPGATREATATVTLSSPVLPAGGTGEVTVSLASTARQGVIGFDFALRFDPGRVQFQEANLASPTFEGWSQSVAAASGVVSFAAYGPPAVLGSADVATFRFRNLSPAPLPLCAAAIGLQNVQVGTATGRIATAPVSPCVDPPELALSPVAEILTLGETQTLTARLTNTGVPRPGATILFQIISGPNAGVDDEETTDASGQATFSYVGAIVGSDVIVATAPIQTGIPVPVTSNPVVVTWEPLGLACDAGGPYETSCSGGPASLQLDGRGSSGAILTYAWSSDCPGAVFDDSTSPTPILTLDCACGISCSVTLEVSDGRECRSCTSSVTVRDTELPSIVPKPAVILWPPNHDYRTLAVTDCVESVRDGCDGTLDPASLQVVSVSSDEPEDAQGAGDGSTPNDIVIVCPNTVQLRAEREGAGNGRVYTITYGVADPSGLRTLGSCNVLVPHDRSGTAIEGPGPGYTVTGCSAMARAGRTDPEPDAIHLHRDSGRGLAISFSLAAPSAVELSIYDVAGRLVRSYHEAYVAGQHTVYWNGTLQAGRPVSTGIYIVRLEAGGTTSAVKVVWRP